MQESTDMFSILDKSMNLVNQQKKEDWEHVSSSDVLLSPRVKQMGKMDVENVREIYEEGRLVALEALPDIKRAIREYQWKEKNRVGLKLAPTKIKGDV